MRSRSFCRALLLLLAVLAAGCAQRAAPPERLKVFADVQQLAAHHPLSRLLPPMKVRAQALERAKLLPLPAAQVGSAVAPWRMSLEPGQFEEREARLADLEAASAAPATEAQQGGGAADQAEARKQVIRSALARRYTLALDRIGPAWHEALRQQTEEEMPETLALLARLAAPDLGEADRQAACGRLQELRSQRAARAEHLRQQRGLALMDEWAQAELALMKWAPEAGQEQAAVPGLSLPPPEEDLRASREALAEWRAARPGNVAQMQVHMPRVQPTKTQPPRGSAAVARAGYALRQVPDAMVAQILFDTAAAALQAAQSRGWDLSVTITEGRTDVTDKIGPEVAELLRREASP
jgi:hypothetical protein